MEYVILNYLRDIAQCDLKKTEVFLVPSDVTISCGLESTGTAYSHGTCIPCFYCRVHYNFKSHSDLVRYMDIKYSFTNPHHPCTGPGPLQLCHSEDPGK